MKQFIIFIKTQKTLPEMEAFFYYIQILFISQPFQLLSHHYSLEEELNSKEHR